MYAMMYSASGLSDGSAPMWRICGPLVWNEGILAMVERVRGLWAGSVSGDDVGCGGLWSRSKAECSKDEGSECFQPGVVAR